VGMASHPVPVPPGGWKRLGLPQAARPSTSLALMPTAERRDRYERLLRRALVSLGLPIRRTP
jgi:hypothetical protein